MDAYYGQIIDDMQNRIESLENKEIGDKLLNIIDKINEKKSVSEKDATEITQKVADIINDLEKQHPNDPYVKKACDTVRTLNNGSELAAKSRASFNSAILAIISAVVALIAGVAGLVVSNTSSGEVNNDKDNSDKDNINKELKLIEDNNKSIKTLEESNNGLNNLVTEKEKQQSIQQAALATAQAQLDTHNSEYDRSKMQVEADAKAKHTAEAMKDPNNKGSVWVNGEKETVLRDAANKAVNDKVNEDISKWSDRMEATKSELTKQLDDTKKAVGSTEAELRTNKEEIQKNASKITELKGANASALERINNQLDKKASPSGVSEQSIFNKDLITGLSVGLAAGLGTLSATALSASYLLGKRAEKSTRLSHIKTGPKADDNIGTEKNHVFIDREIEGRHTPIDNKADDNIGTKKNHVFIDREIKRRHTLPIDNKADDNIGPKADDKTGPKADDKTGPKADDNIGTKKNHVFIDREIERRHTLPIDNKANDKTAPNEDNRITSKEDTDATINMVLKKNSESPKHKNFSYTPRVK